jgi:gluconokinase
VRPGDEGPPVTLVIMGVAGSGKSTILQALGRRLGWPTLDGDDLHPASNVAKMAAGVPLSDADRGPWLDAIAEWIEARDAAGASSIVACSALRRRYRDRFRAAARDLRFVHLVARPEILAARIAGRTGHFMPGALLASQLETLEPLEADERGYTVRATADPASIVEEIVTRRLGALRPPT